MIKKIFRVAIFFSFLIVASCKKSNKEFEKIKLLEQSELEIHNQQVNAWMRMFQVNEQIKTNTLKLSKTVYSKGQFITSFQVGEVGAAIYFISEKNKLITYGIKTELNDGKKSGLVEIFDFQKMDKRGLKFSAGKLTSILTYPKEQHFNNNSLNGQSNQTIRTSSFISGIRKFFCELFGGYWDATIAGNATNSGGSCTTTSNGEGQVESILNSDGGGGSFNWGPIYTNINNPSFFDNNSAFWQSYLNTGGGGPVLGGTQIPQLTFEQKRDFLITTLNLNQNQEFYLINTNNAVNDLYKFLMTSSANNKIEIVIFILDRLSLNPSISFETLSNRFLTTPEFKKGEIAIDEGLITYDQPLTAGILPTLNKFKSAFPKDTTSTRFEQMDAQDVYQLVGGSLYQSYLSDPDKIGNACSIRGSRGLLYSDSIFSIPVLRYNGSQRTQKGGDNKNYILDAVSFNKYMKDKFGDTPHKLEGTDANDPAKVDSLLNGKNGIYVIINNNPASEENGGAGYSGHVDLIVNGSCIGGAYTTPKGGVKSIRVWILN